MRRPLRELPLTLPRSKNQKPSSMGPDQGVASGDAGIGYHYHRITAPPNRADFFQFEDFPGGFVDEFSRQCRFKAGGRWGNDKPAILHSKGVSKREGHFLVFFFG